MTPKSILRRRCLKSRSRERRMSTTATVRTQTWDTTERLRLIGITTILESFRIKTVLKQVNEKLDELICSIVQSNTKQNPNAVLYVKSLFALSSEQAKERLLKGKYSESLHGWNVDCVQAFFYFIFYRRTWAQRFCTIVGTIKQTLEDDTCSAGFICRFICLFIRAWWILWGCGRTTYFKWMIWKSQNTQNKKQIFLTTCFNCTLCSSCQFCCFRIYSRYRCWMV